MAKRIRTVGEQDALMAEAKNHRTVGSWTDHPDRVARNGAALEALETKPPTGGGKPIMLPSLDIRRQAITLIGDSELIVHHWSEKAIREMLQKQMGTATAGREHKDPEQDYKDSLYIHPDGGYGFPSIAFKIAAVEACTSLGKMITKVAARQAFHVMGEFAKIEGEPRMREDMVRVGQGTADIRYRAGFPKWHTRIDIRYNSRVLSAEQIVNLFNTAGFAVGIGEWRSERDGGFGLFHVASEDDINDLQVPARGKVSSKGSTRG